MTSAALEALLHDVFAAQGAVDAAGLARRAARDFEMARRNECIYAFRRDHTERQTAERYGISHQRVRQIVREQIMLLRSIA